MNKRIDLTWLKILQNCSISKCQYNFFQNFKFFLYIYNIKFLTFFSGAETSHAAFVLLWLLFLVSLWLSIIQISPFWWTFTIRLLYLELVDWLDVCIFTIIYPKQKTKRYKKYRSFLSRFQASSNWSISFTLIVWWP